MPPSDPVQNRWFVEQVLPHVPMLRAWLKSRFPTGFEVDDLLQDAFVRVLTAHQERPVQSPKAFLFAVARNLALDRIRRARVTGEGDHLSFDDLEIMDDVDSVPEAVARNQELETLTRAIQSLPARCRQIFTLRKIYNLSQAEIASRMGISEPTVSAQLTIGVQKCSEYFARNRREAGL